MQVQLHNLHETTVDLIWSLSDLEKKENISICSSFSLCNHKDFCPVSQPESRWRYCQIQEHISKLRNIMKDISKEIESTVSRYTFEIKETLLKLIVFIKLEDIGIFF